MVTSSVFYRRLALMVGLLAACGGPAKSQAPVDGGGLPDGEECQSESQCLSGHVCVCADPACESRRCNALACAPCKYWSEAAGCDGGDIDLGLNPDERCQAPLACNGAGACELADGDLCQIPEDCAEGHFCDCADATCLSRVCNATSCAPCQYTDGSGDCLGDIAGGFDPLAACSGSLVCNGKGACQAQEYLFGYFVGSQETQEITHANWNILLIDSWGDDMEAVADYYESRGMTASLFAAYLWDGSHHLHPDYEANFAQMQQFIAPLEARGLMHSILVADEPRWNGTPAADIDTAVDYVKSFGYKTMIVEWYDSAIDPSNPRPDVDYYGVTCYTFGNTVIDVPQSTCISAYNNHSGWNLVVGQAFDVGGGWTDQAQWYDLSLAKDGLVWWVWRYPGQTGAADSPTILLQHEAMDLYPF